MKLIYKGTGVPVKVGDEIPFNWDGDEADGRAVVTGIELPHHPASTGRVYLRRLSGYSDYEQRFFPCAIGAEWDERPDRD